MLQHRAKEIKYYNIHALARLASNISLLVLNKNAAHAPIFKNIGFKFQLVQREHISPYDYMWKLNFVPARQESYPPGISLNFSLQACQFTKL